MMEWKKVSEHPKQFERAKKLDEVLLFNKLWGMSFGEFQIGWWDEENNIWEFISHFEIPGENEPEYLDAERESMNICTSKELQPEYFAILIFPDEKE